MDEKIYRACVSNVKELKKHRARLRKLVNTAIKEKKDDDLDTFTKFYALLFSAYVEVSFLKLIHTPKALDVSEITQIQRGCNLEEKWKTCVQFAFLRINSSANSGEIANKKQTLTRIMSEYIIAPSQMRNKIAHGQWKICLNNQCTGINDEITNEILQLDFVKIDRYFEIYNKFQQCILDLLVSQRTHYRDYYSLITELEEYIISTKDWTIQTKKMKILSSSKIQRYT